MRVLITGAGGFIGSHLVEDQLNRGREVTAVDLKVSWLETIGSNPKLTIIEGDFANRSLLDPHLKGHDICFHLASAHLEKSVSDEYFWKVNVQATREFVERCYDAGISRFVHCSSVGVFGDIKNPPADEESECYPDVAYERSKLAGERAVLEFAQQCDYDVVVIRPAWVYGPRCPRTQKLFRTIKKGRFFYVGAGRTLRHPIYITDMVNGFEIAAAHENSRGEVFIMAGPRAVTLEELVNGIASSVGASPPRLKLPKSVVWMGCLLLEAGAKATGREAPFTRRSMKFYTGNTAFSIEKARKMIGFNPVVDLQDGLDWTCNWLKENHAI